MVKSSTPTIVAAERLNDGIVIKFGDGQCALFTTQFLFSKLPECEKLNDAKIEW